MDQQEKPTNQLLVLYACVHYFNIPFLIFIRHNYGWRHFTGFHALTPLITLIFGAYAVRNPLEDICFTLHFWAAYLFLFLRFVAARSNRLKPEAPHSFDNGTSVFARFGVTHQNAAKFWEPVLSLSVACLALVIGAPGYGAYFIYLAISLNVEGFLISHHQENVYSDVRDSVLNQKRMAEMQDQMNL